MFFLSWLACQAPEISTTNADSNVAALGGAGAGESFSDISGSRLKRIMYYGTDGTVASANEWFDLELQTKCTFQAYGVSGLYCVPVTTATPSNYYGLDDCSDAPLALDMSPCCEPQFAKEEYCSGGTNTVTVYPLGERYTGPVWAIQGGNCIQMPSAPPNYHMYYMAEALPADMLVQVDRYLE